VGIHLIVATQRPSVDIITGKIKTNLASRIAFRTTQGVDSKTILDRGGAEKLLGNGDMLFLRSGAPDLERYHGSFISEEDVESIVGFVKAQAVSVEKIESFEKAVDGEGGAAGGGGGDRDELFQEAARIISNLGQGSTSLLQRRMKIGFARAGRLMDELEQAGIVGPQDGAKPREVLLPPDQVEDLLGRLYDTE
jgi:DNA segregation ATPase FtsK/SpoIIIE, S-DNA-T family